MRGILGWGVYLPNGRLDRSTIAAVAGGGGGRGTRTAASYDEDTTTMGVEAGRRVLHSLPGVEPASVWFATVAPAYLDKTNATALHAALRLDAKAGAYDVIGSTRSTLGALRAGLGASGSALVVASDLRTGLPGSPDETAGGDGAAAVLVGDDTDAPILAEIFEWTSLSAEFVDRWRTPGDLRSKSWEERFGETRYVPLATEAWARALEHAGVEAGDVDLLVVTGTHDRAVGVTAKKLGVDGVRVVDNLAASVGNTGAAHPLVLLAAALEQASPGQLVALVVLADGAEVILARTTNALGAYHPVRPVAEQAASGFPVPYGKFLAWRGVLPVEPPRRPEPSRPSASAASRATDWKFGFVGSERSDGPVHLPPAALDDQRRPMADALGTITTFTIDRLAYSPSPPVVFAVVDFDGGGRAPLELTDVDPADVAVGNRVEMTFRRLFTADGIHNYFWKARPLRAGGG
jgi:3-hydroxy-3-methylglutaryl CoA synthase/uncharacterized OB-fold protein